MEMRAMQSAGVSIALMTRVRRVGFFLLRRVYHQEGLNLRYHLATPDLL